MVYADRTFTQYDRLLASYCCLTVCLEGFLCIVALRVGVGVGSCAVVFLGRHFLFTS